MKVIQKLLEGKKHPYLYVQEEVRIYLATV